MLFLSNLFNMRKHIFSIFITWLLICSTHFLCKAQSQQYFVAPNGNIHNSGSQASPLATLEQARNAIRQTKEKQGHLFDSTIVWLRGGIYTIDHSFILDSRDAGLPGAPVVYRAYPGEKVILRGGASLPTSAFQPVQDKSIIRRMVKEARSQVLQADLKALGITNFGTIHSRGMGIPVKPYPMELFFNEALMQVARWPNKRYAEYGKVTKVGSIPRYRNMTIAPGGRPIDPNNPPPEFAPYINDTTNTPGSFIYLNDRPKRWTEAKDVWLFGYWNKRWASQTLKIANIDTQKKEITLTQPHHYGLKDAGTFYAFNLLEEIDQPGEYYIDHHNGILYFWPPSDINQAEIVVSLADDPIIQLKNTSNIIIQGLTLEVTRGDCLKMEGGSNNLIMDCIIRNIGLNGLQITNNITAVNFDSQKDTQKEEPVYYSSRNNGVTGCELYKIRGDGISLQGGDRTTLTPGNNFAINNHLHDEANIQISGCGNRVAHNLIHDNPWGAIQYSGNDHLIEYNELVNCLTDADDWGVIYTGRNPSSQGTVIRYNYIHHNTGPVEGGTGSNGIYLDDGTSGQIVYGNVIYKSGSPARANMGGVFMHGGKDNLVANNVFIDCKLAVGFTPWRQDHWEKFLVTRDMKIRLYDEVNIESPLYQQRYPLLGRLEKDAGVNKIWNNLVVNCERFMGQPADRAVDHDVQSNWITTENPGFENGEEQVFQLHTNAKVYDKIPDFQCIPFEKIGLIKNIKK